MARQLPRSGSAGISHKLAVFAAGGAFCVAAAGTVGWSAPAPKSVSALSAVGAPAPHLAGHDRAARLASASAHPISLGVQEIVVQAARRLASAHVRSAAAARPSTARAVRVAAMRAAARRAAAQAAAKQAARQAAARAAAEQAARQAAARQAAARAAAEQAAQQAAAEQAAQQAAAQQAAEQAAAQQAAEQAAARSAAEQAVPSGSPQQIAEQMLSTYGWSAGQFSCLQPLWERESGWNPYAQNPSSGAYGIPQSLPGDKMASAGSDWRSDPVTQIRWGLTYIQGRYGSPCAAWAHEQAVGWY